MKRRRRISVDSQKLEPADIPPPSEIKRKLIELQLKRMEQNMEPIGLDFAISTLGEIQRFHSDIIRLLFERRLSSSDLKALNGLLANQIRLLMPSEIEARIDELLEQAKSQREAIDQLKAVRSAAPAIDRTPNSMDGRERAAER